MSPRADLLVTHARVWTDGALRPESDAIAIGGGRILAVGRAADIEALAAPGAERIDAKGATVTPGLTDAHIHLVAWARARSEVSLHDARSAEACVARVRAAAAAGGHGALVGRGWDSNEWSGAPHRVQLDAIGLDRPVLLHSRDYHALWVNSAALQAVGITRDTPDPPAGRFERDATGDPNGIVREHAVRAFLPLEPGEDDASVATRLTDAARELLAMGITTVHDFEDARAYRALERHVRHVRTTGPRLRVLMYLAHAGLDDALAAGVKSAAGDGWFGIGGVKLFADGTLGSRTAAMIEPYEGSRELGMELIAPDAMRDIVGRALRGGIAVAVHAIGDRAARNVLDAIEAAGDAARVPALRSRIEHLQLAAEGDVQRLARLGVVASMQPVHCTTDMTLADRHWGARVERSYPWRDVLDAGGILAFGSDAPVEAPDPSEGLYAAVTRQRSDGSPPGGWTPRQRVTLDQALEAYTAAPAALAGHDGTLGTLRAGAAADLVVWDRDLHRSDAEAIRRARPAFTLLDGTVVHRNPAPERRTTTT